MGKGTGEEQATPTVPPRGEDKRHPGEQWGDSGGHGEDAYPGRSLLRVASGLMPSLRIPCLGTNWEQTDGYPFSFFNAREPFN